jgi:hypothetical protein
MIEFFKKHIKALLNIIMNTNQGFLFAAFIDAVFRCEAKYGMDVVKEAMYLHI